MVWSDNGWIKYSGQKNERSTPSLACVPVEPVAGHSTIPQVWDPASVLREQNVRAQGAVLLAQQGGVPVTLRANGDLVEATTDDPHVAILTRTLEKRGRHPVSEQELNDWGKEDGIEEVARFTMQQIYNQRYTPLPSVKAESAETKRHTLGSLGLRSASKMTQAQFAEKLRYHNVPEDQHWALAFEAFEKGHIVKESDEQGLTFQPGTMAKDQRDKKGHTFQPGAPMAAEAEERRQVVALNATIDRLYAHQRRPRPGYVAALDGSASGTRGC